MRSPLIAIAWEFWGANRRGWLLVLAALAACGLLFHLFAGEIRDPESLAFFSYLPLVAALTLAISFCNFTDRERRDGMAGFPRHLFSLPINTQWMVSCALACSVVSVVGVYAAWVVFVLRPLDVKFMLLWPTMLLAAFVVFYQAIVWCLCGFRLTRVVSMSLVATMLVAVGFLPTLLSKESFWASRMNLSVALTVLMAAAYGAMLATVGVQRRGGARGWTGFHEVIDRLTRVFPQQQVVLKTSHAALFWSEWRRSGLVLPAAVVLTGMLIFGPVMWFTGRGDKETMWAEMWLAIIPMLLAIPVGMGFGKPDFWSLDLTLSPFITTRPITSTQLVAAKVKTAALSVVATWTVVLIMGPLCVYLWCDTSHWKIMAGTFSTLYSPVELWLLLIFALVTGMLATWSFLVANLWLGYCGRPKLYYSFTGAGLAAFLVMFFWFVWWLDHPRTRGEIVMGMLPWLPWALAVLVTIKVWAGVFICNRLLARRQISQKQIAACAGAWLLAASCVVLFGWFWSPRIEWFRNLAMLSGFLAIPLATLAATPMSVSWNRHQ